jgi:pantoate--beta-alanine ligase
MGWLSARERVQATALWAALKEGESAITAGADATEAERSMLERLNAESEVAVQYAKVVHPATFVGWDGAPEALLVIAAKVGATRLIDNLPVYRDQLAGAETKERN